MLCHHQTDSYGTVFFNSKNFTFAVYIMRRIFTGTVKAKNFYKHCLNFSLVETEAYDHDQTDDHRPFPSKIALKLAF